VRRRRLPLALAMGRRRLRRVVVVPVRRRPLRRAVLIALPWVSARGQLLYRVLVRVPGDESVRQ
jgi:hypothetical protein